jgi:hypothetical protein
LSVTAETVIKIDAISEAIICEVVGGDEVLLPHEEQNDEIAQCQIKKFNPQ